MKNENPTLSQVIKDAIESKLTNLHVALPARVESYNMERQYVSVQPLVKKKYKSSEVVNLPIINNVPVAFQRTNKAYITFPIKKGDTGLLIFCERSIDLWKIQGGIVDPKDTRKHDLSDAVFYPGLYPFNDNINPDPDAIVIENNELRIKVNPGGTISISNGVNELISILSEWMQAVINAKTNTFIGRQPLLGVEFPDIKSKLDTLKE